MDFLAQIEAFRLAAPLSDIALLIARLIMGITFFYYGRYKIRDLGQNAKDFEEVHGFKPGWLWGSIVALLETVGSILLILGILTPLMAFGFAVHMTMGTLWKTLKTDKPFTDWSYDLLALAIALLLLVNGPGAYAINLF